jgi:predicted ArsR family transcriptional regulator
VLPNRLTSVAEIADQAAVLALAAAGGSGWCFNYPVVPATRGVINQTGGRPFFVPALRQSQLVPFLRFLPIKQRPPGRNGFRCKYKCINSLVWFRHYLLFKWRGVCHTGRLKQTALATKLKVSSTKSQILALLKRSGGSSVDDLTRSLGLAPMTVRQHLTQLERDSLVSAREVRRATGRPHFVYSLTAGGDEMFPRRYDVLAELILQEVALLEPQDIADLDEKHRMELVLERVAERVAADHRPRFEGKTLNQRVELLTQLLQEESGFAEFERTDKGWEVRDYNCAYHKLVDSNPNVCHWHLTLMQKLLGESVWHERSLCAGSECCRFLIEPGSIESTVRATAVEHS